MLGAIIQACLKATSRPYARHLPQMTTALAVAITLLPTATIIMKHEHVINFQDAQCSCIVQDSLTQN
jgi:hypothetical protein